MKNSLGEIKYLTALELCNLYGFNKFRHTKDPKAKRYFSSTVYVTNTIIGPVVGTILSAAILFAGLDTITNTIQDTIPAKALLDSKILLNISLILPFYFLSEIMLILAIKPGISELLWLLLIPGVLILFAVVFGITVNLKFRNFDWTKEGTVVKQGASSAIGGFGGMLISLLCCGFAVGLQVLLGQQWRHLSYAVICLVLLLITALLYRKNNRVRLTDL